MSNLCYQYDHYEADCRRYYRKKKIKRPWFKADLSFAANYCFEGAFGNKFKLFAVASSVLFLKGSCFVCIGQGLVQSSLG